MIPTDESWVLLSAHHCAPDMGSEHAVGFNYLRELAARYRILLVTEDNEFRPALEARIAGWNAAGAQVEAHFVQHGVRSDGRKNNLRLGFYLSYALYQWRVLRLARRLCAERPVALVHHLTIVGFREPGFLWRLGRPFVWGPVGGLVFAPAPLRRWLSPKMRAFQAIRNAVTALQFRLSPRVRLAYRATQRSGSFVAATDDIGRRFVARFGGSYLRVPETGAALPPTAPGASASVAGPLRLLWVGGLIDIKPLEPLLRAIAASGLRSEIQLDVVGDGSAGDRYRGLARELGIQARFHGWVDHAVARAMFGDQDLFVLFSMKDLTTNVVFEALAAGLPVLCLDHHGYSEIVNERCGYKIPIQAPEPLVGDVAGLLRSLVQDRSGLRARRAGARARAEAFTWEANADAIAQIYERLAGKSIRLPAAAEDVAR